MVQVDPKPDPEEIERRRKLDPTKYIIDPNEVAPKDDMRARKWAAEMMKKHESKLDLKVKENTVIASGVVEPESIDVRNIYPFKDLQWYIYRRGRAFHFMLTTDSKKMLFISAFYKI